MIFPLFQNMVSHATRPVCRSAEEKFARSAVFALSAAAAAPTAAAAAALSDPVEGST